MKIHNDESVVTVQQLRKGAQEQPAKTKKSDPPPTDGDQVQLSDRAREFNRIKDVLETLPDLRSDKVQILSDAVDQGTYTADDRASAEKLIRESLIDILA
jgi:flagellar biosynthesis anti-sigma factor FlgM